MSGEIIYTDSDAFGQFNVHEMSESEWALESATPTAIKDPRCHIILFYEPNGTDPALMDIWREIARNIGGPVIAAVNTSARRDIMAAFFKVQGDLNDPFNVYTGFRTPSILVYRSRWPQAFYNGELSYDALVAWITNLACKPGYRELDAYNTNTLVGPGPSTYYQSRDPDFEGDGVEGDIGGENLDDVPVLRENIQPLSQQTSVQEGPEPIKYASAKPEGGYSTPATSSPLPPSTSESYDVGFI